VEADVDAWRYALLVVHARKEEVNALAGTLAVERSFNFYSGQSLQQDLAILYCYKYDCEFATSLSFLL